MALRAARAWGTDPLVYLGHTEPGKPWSKRSRALAEGLMLYEENINQYGIPIQEATDPEMDGWYEIDDSVVDYAVAAMEDYRKNNKNVEPGAQLRVVNTRVDDSERPEGARRPDTSEEDLSATSSGLPKESTL